MTKLFLVVLVALLLAGCGSDVDPTPEKLDGTFEQCDNVAEGGSDFCWECQQIGNKKCNEENT